MCRCNMFHVKMMFVNVRKGGSQSLLRSTNMGLTPLLMMDVKVYYSQQEWVQPLW